MTRSEHDQDQDEDEAQDEDDRQRAGSEPPVDDPIRGKEIMEQGRIEILKGQKFITKDPNYETSLFDKWTNINKKFHLVGWKHLRSWRAYVEMFSELQAFLYEIVGNVDREKRISELAFLEAELAAIRQRPARIRIPLMYNLAAHLFHNVDLGLKKPSEKSIFDLDVEKIFEDHKDAVLELDRIQKEGRGILKP